MRLRSFRLRLALLSAGLAGSALIGFGAISWKLIYDAKVSRLDASIESQLRRAARPRFDRWQFEEAQLTRELDVSPNTPIALLVLDQNGAPLYQSQNWSLSNSVFPSTSVSWAGAPLSESFRSRRPDGPPPELPSATRYTTQRNWRVGAVRFPHVQLAIAVRLDSIDQEMTVIRSVFLISIPIVLLLVAGGAWSLSGSALRPVQQLTTTMQNVTAQGLAQRVPSGAIDVEFAELTAVFNQMLERLERSFKQASRFSGDAAHELKTPLTILQGELEQALQQAETDSEMRRLGNLLDEVRRLSGIVRKLLLLSLADAGQMSLYKAEVNLAEIVAEMIDDLELLAPHLRVQTEIADLLPVWGDRDLLIQVLQNLFSNAVKYNLPDGWIRIQAYQRGSTAFVTIENASKSIPPSDRALIFDRFYRSDPARARRVEGTGLGLSLAREIARAHGGDLMLAPALPNQTTFILSLPIVGAES